MSRHVARWRTRVGAEADACLAHYFADEELADGSAFRVASTCGCAKLTILRGKFNLLGWLRKRLEITTLDETDYAILF